MKVVIAGSRNVDDYKLLERVIKDSGFKITEVCSGCAKGVDSLGEMWAEQNKVPIKKFPADWKNITTKGAVVAHGAYGPYNKLAGISRNKLMANYCDAGIVIIKDNSSGSGHMVECLNNLEKKVYVYEF